MIVRRFAIRCARASESRYRESDSPEQITGIIVTGAGTFLIRYAVIGSLNEKLSRSDYSYHREDAEGDVYGRSCVGGRELTVENAVDSVGKLVALATTSTTTNALLNLSTENNRLYSLDDRSGIVVTDGIEIADVAIVVVGTGGIRGNVSFSTVENYILFQSGDALEGLTSANSEASLKLEEDVISDVDLIKSVIERNLIYTDVSPENLCALGLNVGRSGENFLSEGSKIYTCILVAISVTATIENPFSVYAHRSSQILVTSEGSVSVFLHCNFSSFKVLKAHSTIMIWSVI